MGLGLGRWELRSREDFSSIAHEGPEILRKVVGGRRWSELSGFVYYRLFEIAPCESLALELPVGVEDILGAVWTAGVSWQSDPALSVKDLVGKWGSEFNGSPVNVITVRISPTLAFRIFQESWPGFHVVPLWPRCRPSHSLLEISPSLNQIRDFIQCQPHDVLPPAPAMPPDQRESQQLDSFRSVIAWLKASQDLKQLRKARDSKRAWAEVFAAGDAELLHLLDKTTPNVQYDTLRRGRVRLDMTTCLLFRDRWKAAVASRKVHAIYMFTDASPQWRGKEMVATTLELHVWPFQEEPFVMLLPLIHIGSDMLSSTGKAFALLWQCFLVVGPSWKRLVKFTEAVVAFTTDLGAERLLARIKDLLPAFCAHLHIPMPANAPRRLRTFPRAIPAPGWHHIFDGLVQRGLNSADWFPSWLASLKILLAFLREHMLDIERDLGAIGRQALAEVLSSVSLPSFAKWRWSTLNAVVRSLSKIFTAFQQAWGDLKFIKKTRNTSTIKSLQQTVANPTFGPKLAFVLFFTDWLNTLERWGGGCHCHADQYRLGEPVDCWRKGRLLQYAWGHACKELAWGLRESGRWAQERFHPLGLDFLSQIQSIVRMVHGVAFEKLKHLNRLPYLLARWGEGHIKTLALEQFSSVGPEMHDAVTLEFFQEGSVLRSILDSCTEAEALDNPRFLASINELRNVCLDDSRCESPHARATRVGTGSRRSKWPWIASTVRMRQNIDLVQNPDFFRQSAFWWHRFKSVLQFDPKHERRSKKIPWKTAVRQFYWIPSGAGFADQIEDLCFANMLYSCLTRLFAPLQTQPTPTLPLTSTFPRSPHTLLFMFNSLHSKRYVNVDSTVYT